MQVLLLWRMHATSDNFNVSKPMLCLLLSGGITITPQLQAQSTDICPTLKQLVSLAESEFASVKGAPWKSPGGRLIDGAWDSTLKISGGECAVLKDDDDPAYYSCTWRLSSEQAAINLAMSLASASSNCLRIQAQDLGASSRGSRRTFYSAVVEQPGQIVNSIRVSTIATSRTVRGEPRIEVSLDVAAER